MFLILASIMLCSIGIAANNAFADKVIGTIPVNGAFGVATNPNTDLTYVATGSNQIQVIDDKTKTATASIQTHDPVPAPNSGNCVTLFVAVNPNTNMIYTRNGGCQYKTGMLSSIYQQLFL